MTTHQSNIGFAVLEALEGRRLMSAALPWSDAAGAAAGIIASVQYQPAEASVIAVDTRLPTLIHQHQTFANLRVIGLGSGVPTGTVTFFTRDGAVVAVEALDEAGGVTRPLSYDHAVYSGDETFRPSRTDGQRITAVTSTPAHPGGPVEVLVAARQISSHEVPISVKLVAGDEVLAEATLDGGMHRFGPLTLPAGQRVDVVYTYVRYGIRDGIAGMDYGSSMMLTDVVNVQPAGTKAVPMIQASVSSQWWYGGHEVTFMVKVIGTMDGPVPTGTVNVAGHTVTLDARGEASVTLIAAARPGSEGVGEVVTYSGDGNYEAASDDQDLQRDGVFLQYHGAPDAKLTLTQSSATSKRGEAVTLTATLKRDTSSGSVHLYQMRFRNPAGSVVFLADGKVIGTAAVDAAGVAQLTTSQIPPGAHTITARHVDEVWGEGNTDTPLTHTVTVDPLQAVDGTLLAQGDLDGDGETDRIYLRPSDNRYVFRRATGDGIEFMEQMILSPKDPGWQLAGTADFNGDGTADIVWRNDQTGKASVWFMNGANIRGFGMFNHAPRDTAWRIHAIDDVDGDGNADLIWKHGVTGKAYTWLMRRTSVIGTRA